MSNDSKSEVFPLHRRVDEAEGGDAGWVWHEGAWRLAQITFGDDDDINLYVDMILPSGSRWFTMDELAHLPWLEIPRPPYEGNEMPCTHAVIIMDRAASLTFSWNMNVGDGKKTLQRITASIDAMLRETDAPAAVG